MTSRKNSIVKCVNKNGTHSGRYLENVLQLEVGVDEEQWVNWCSECGLVTVDFYDDGRFVRSLTGLKTSNLYKRLVQKGKKK